MPVSYCVILLGIGIAAPAPMVDGPAVSVPLLGPAGKLPRAKNHAELCRREVEVAVSSGYLDNILRWKPGVSNLSCLQGRKDKIGWLRQHLKAEALPDPDRPTLRITWLGRRTPDAEVIVRVIGEMYVEERRTEKYRKRLSRISNHMEIVARLELELGFVLERSLFHDCKGLTPEQMWWTIEDLEKRIKYYRDLADAIERGDVND